MAEDYYALLGVAPGASDEEIKRAYRQRARELHPDSSGDPESEALFKEVTKAYDTLRDPERRRRYDMFGPDRAGASGMGGMDPNAFFGGGFGNLFDTIFQATQGGARRGGPPHGDDAEIVVTLSFAESVFGGHKEVTVRQPVTCTTCEGSGARPGTSPTTCPDCHGTGEVRRVRQSILGQMITASACPRCRATGRVVDDPCRDCHGDGRRTEATTFAVDIPAGVEAGTTLRLSGRGPAGPRGGPAGDLYVHLSVGGDDRFTRVGDDIHCDVHVGVAQAALGAEVTVATLEGDEAVVVPAGVQGGHLFRLKGHGVPHLRGRGRGDLIARLVVDTPTDLTESQVRLLRELAAERGEAVVESHQGIMSKIRSAFG